MDPFAWYLLWYDGEVGPELPQAEERAMAQQVDAYLKRFLMIPQADSRQVYQNMVDFAETVTDPHLRELLEVALNGRGAFHRFKDVLFNYQDERDRWFAYNAQRWRERIDDWLKAEGMHVDDRQPLGKKFWIEAVAIKLFVDNSRFPPLK